MNLNLWMALALYLCGLAGLCGLCVHVLGVEVRVRHVQDVRGHWQVTILLAAAFGLAAAYGGNAALRLTTPVFLGLAVLMPIVTLSGMSLFIRLYKRVRRGRILPEPGRHPERRLDFFAFLLPAAAQVLCAGMLVLGLMALAAAATWPPARAYLPLWIGLAAVGAVGCGMSFLRVEYHVTLTDDGLHVRWRAGLFPEYAFTCLWRDVRKVRMGRDEKQVTFQLRSGRGWFDCQCAATPESLAWYGALEAAAFDALGVGWRDGAVVLRTGGRVRLYPNRRGEERARDPEREVKQAVEAR